MQLGAGTGMDSIMGLGIFNELVAFACGLCVAMHEIDVVRRKHKAMLPHLHGLDILMLGGGLDAENTISLSTRFSNSFNHAGSTVQARR